jgi:hypothetical protein
LLELLTAKWTKISLVVSFWEKLRINKHKEKLLTYLTNKTTENNSDSFAAFASIFMDLKIAPDFTDNEMLAGLKHIALNDPHPEKRRYAKQIMQEGSKTIEDIKLTLV